MTQVKPKPGQARAKKNKMEYQVALHHTEGVFLQPTKLGI